MRKMATCTKVEPNAETAYRNSRPTVAEISSGVKRCHAGRAITYIAA